MVRRRRGSQDRGREACGGVRDEERVCGWWMGRQE